MKIKKSLLVKSLILVLLIAVIAGLFIFRDSFPLLSELADRELLKAKIESYGVLAPVVYMIVQMAQVFIAPIPGEMTGILGGYFFGTWKGFIFSTIALTGGSFLNFVIARYAGKEVMRKVIPGRYWEKFDRFFEEEGNIFILALFIFPGFPKDYFCLFLGITNLELRLFILFASLGRIPGTLLLSVQGSLIYEGAYLLTIILAVFVGLVSFLMIFYRKKIYLWFKKDSD